MKKSKTVLLIIGVLLAAVLSINQYVSASETKAFFKSRIAEQNAAVENTSNLTIASHSLEVLMKNLPYLNSK